jgi:hypothetical protein
VCEYLPDLDLTRPVAVLLIGVLHFIPDDDDPWGIVTRLLDGITGDAYLLSPTPPVRKEDA